MEGKKRKHITPEDVELMRMLKRCGRKTKEIAAIIGCSDQCVLDNLDPVKTLELKEKRAEQYKRKKAREAEKAAQKAAEEIRKEEDVTTEGEIQLQMAGIGGLPEGWIATELEGIRRELKQIREEQAINHRAQAEWREELRRFLGNCWRGMMGLFKARREEEGENEA